MNTAPSSSPNSSLNASTPSHKTEPDHNDTGWPAGIRYIIGNEGCERFSYYGMRAILYIYLVHLFELTGLTGDMAQNQATAVNHFFAAGVYALPMIGAIAADRYLGKYKTILWLSIIYCFGHLVLSLTEDTVWGCYAGLGLIAVGSGGIKPCVSAHVGDQFGRGNWHMLDKVYQGFYFIINFGSAFATLMIPKFQEWWGWSVAFAIPGVLMAIATFFFWQGRKVFIHVPPSPGGKLGLYDTLVGAALFLALFGWTFIPHQVPGWGIALFVIINLSVFVALFNKRQSLEAHHGFLFVLYHSVFAWLYGKAKGKAGEATKSNDSDQWVIGDEASVPRFFHSVASKYGAEVVEGPVAVLKLSSVFVLVSVFWALFDQHSSSWIRQAGMMDLAYDLPLLGKGALSASQIPALNPFMVMGLIPLFSFIIIPLVEKMGVVVTPLRKMTVGMIMASAAFVSVALIQGEIDAGLVTGDKISVLWQFIPYLVITVAEVLVSITGLEFAYSQAPKSMKSVVMGLWLLSVSLGNLMVGFLAQFGNMELQQFFWFFAGLMLLAGLLFGLRAKFYTTREFAQ